MSATLIDEPVQPGAPATRPGTAVSQASEARSSADAPGEERVVTTRELLGSGHRLWIQHAAQRYLLQVTRNGKLILTK